MQAWLAGQPQPPPEGVVLEAFDITAAEADRPCWAFAKSVMARLLAQDHPRASPDRRDNPNDEVLYADDERLYGRDGPKPAVRYAADERLYGR